jgi:predicted transcriptional regulator YheO
MTNQEIFDLFIPLVDFLGELLGENTEILLHDISNPEESVIAVSHGFHSGREVGSPLTELGHQIIADQELSGKRYLANYKAVSKGKQYISSTYYIKNGESLIGMLCFNTDISAAQNLLAATDRFIKSTNLGAFLDPAVKDKGIQEDLDTPITSLVENTIETTIAEQSVPPARMTREEKRQVVWTLAEHGIPRMKGAVAEIARQLDLSESTVYRYLNQKE